jgi:hypothetical protein
MAGDVENQIDGLRSRLEELAAPRVPSAFSNIAYRTWTASRQATASVRGKIEFLRATIRGNALSWVLIAAATGFLFSRLRN